VFGNLGQLAHLLRNAGQIKKNMQEMQTRLEAARYVGEAGGGQIRVTADGKGDVLEIKIDPALVKDDDVELLEDLLCAAVRDVITKSREGAQKEMQALTGGMDMQGMMDSLGGGGQPE
jgi:DNA-binding YbaB/EbfC family protein